MMKELLSKILVFNINAIFYRYSNADGKTWVMPAMNMGIAMNLYQPSGIKGKMVKIMFPCLHRIGLVRNVLRAETLNCSLNDELRSLLCNVFNSTDIEFSIFCGTPCVHQKVTIQLSRGNAILGYCKLSESEDIARLFERESQLLSYLSEEGVVGVPRSLYCGKLTNDIYIFVQSTVKSQSSRLVHEWSVIHESFLERLYAATFQKIQFEKSDYYRTLQELKKHYDWLPKELDCSIIIKTIEEILEKYSGQMVNFVAYHGDFTPWNMFVDNAKLFVFDFEYAALTYPPMLDRYHFFTQTSIFEKHWGSDEIISYIQSKNGNWIDVEIYKLYLLDVISKYTLREKGKFDKSLISSFNIWIKLLENIER